MAETKHEESTVTPITVTEFGSTKDGIPVQKFTFANGNGYEIEMLNYGATIVSVKAPDRDGNVANVALGCDDIESYEANEASLGATVGRFCNRIAGAQFEIDGRQYHLTANDGANTLHGGKNGFKQKVWDAELIENANTRGVRFSTVSPDGEEGFPGTVNVSVVYLLNNKNELSIEFSATTDKATHINLTNHCYWNLTGVGETNVYDHLLQINAEHFVDVDAAGIPSGELKPLSETPLDFNQPKSVGADIEKLTNTPQGYDHSYVLNSQRKHGGQDFAARLSEKSSGRQLQISTDLPALQFYSSNYMDGQAGSGGHGLHAGIALETQHFPDAPNHDHFPSTLLMPGDEFRSKTVIKFSVMK